MKQIFLAAILFVTTAAAAQKTIQDAHAQQRSVGSFRAVEASDGIDLYISQGGTEALAVSASTPEYRDNIYSEVINGVLKLSYKKPGSGWRWSWGENRKLKAYITVKDLEHLTASGGSDVYLENRLQVNNLTMRLTGGSDFRGTIQGKTLNLSASGGSDAYLSGEVESVKLSASGGSDIHGYEMNTDYCSVSTSGGSDIRIRVNKEISGSASGGSDVVYKGNATSSASKSGGSSIRKAN